MTGPMCAKFRGSHTDPFYDRGSTFIPLFCFWKTGFLDPKSSERQSWFRKKSFGDSGHGITRRDAIWFLLKSVFGWCIELLNWGASENLEWTSIVERLYSIVYTIACAQTDGPDRSPLLVPHPDDGIVAGSGSNHLICAIFFARGTCQKTRALLQRLSNRAVYFIAWAGIKTSHYNPDRTPVMVSWLGGRVNPLICDI